MRCDFPRLDEPAVELRRQYVYLLASREREQGGGVRVRASKVDAPTPGRLDTLNLLGPAARGRSTATIRAVRWTSSSPWVSCSC